MKCYFGERGLRARHDRGALIRGDGALDDAAMPPVRDIYELYCAYCRDADNTDFDYFDI